MPKPDLDPNDPAPQPVAYVPGSTTIWQNSWRRVLEYFGSMIIAYARREGLNEHSAEDVLQEVMTTLIQCQHGQATGHNPNGGSFQAWLKGVVHNRIRSIRRKDRKEAPLSTLSDPDSEQGPGSDSSALRRMSQPPPDFERMDEERWQKAILVAAMEKVRTSVKPENFAIFTALLEERESREALARKYQKDLNNVYAIKHRCEAMVIAEAKAIQEAWRLLRNLPP